MTEKFITNGPKDDNVEITPGASALTGIATRKITEALVRGFPFFLNERRNQVQTGAITFEEANKLAKEAAIADISDAAEFSTGKFNNTSRDWVTEGVLTKEEAVAAVRNIMMNRLTNAATSGFSAFKTERRDQIMAGTIAIKNENEEGENESQDVYSAQVVSTALPLEEANKLAKEAAIADIVGGAEFSASKFNNMSKAWVREGVLTKEEAVAAVLDIARKQIVKAAEVSGSSVNNIKREWLNAGVDVGNLN